MEIVHVTPENSLYILPLEDGNTAVTFLDDAQVKLVTWAHDPDEEDCDIKQSIIDYAKYFTNEYRLKVSLFKEMVRTLPSWVQVHDYKWLDEILEMSTKGDLIDPTEELTLTEQYFLKWLIFTINDPKVTKLSEKCCETLLEKVNVGNTKIIPSEIYLLEHKEPRMNGDVSYGFLVPSPSELFSLIYLFPDSAKGMHLHEYLWAALRKLTSRHSFALSGCTDTRYHAVLMMEYLLHPGIKSMYQPQHKKKKKNVETSDIYLMSEPTNARPIAILLYKVPAELKRWRSKEYLYYHFATNNFIIFIIVSLSVIGRTLYKLTKSN